MGRGIINLIIGGVMVVGGLSGGLMLKGTQSSGGLAVVGLVLIGVGIYRMANNKPGGS